MYRMDGFLLRFFFPLFTILIMSAAFFPDTIHSQSISTSEFDIRQEFEKRMNLFEKVIRNIQQDNLNKLKQMENDIDKAISFLDTWQQTRQSIARGIRARTASDELANQLSGEFVDIATEAESTRMELSMSWPLFIENPRETDQYAEKIKNLVEDHQLLLEKADKMSQYLSDISLPNMSGFYGPDQISLDEGQQCEVKFTIENISSSSWNEVKLTAETSGGDEMKTIWTDPNQIAKISPGKAVQFNLCIDENLEKQDLVTLHIESNEFSEMHMIQILE